MCFGSTDRTRRRDDRRACRCLPSSVVLPRLAAVRAAFEIRVDRPDRVGPIRIDEDLVVVRGAAAAIPIAAGTAPARRLRPSSSAPMRPLRCAAAAAAAGRRHDPADARPRRARVVGTIEAGLVNDGPPAVAGRRRATTAAAVPRGRLGADQRIDARRVPRIDGRARCGRRRLSAGLSSASSTSCPRWSILQMPAFGTAADHLADRAPPLIRRGVEDVGFFGSNTMSLMPVSWLTSSTAVQVAPPSVVL